MFNAGWWPMQSALPWARCDLRTRAHVVGVVGRVDHQAELSFALLLVVDADIDRAMPRSLRIIAAALT
jgi:hypothetical protein